MATEGQFKHDGPKDRDGKPIFDADGKHTYWIMPLPNGVDMHVEGPYPGEDEMLSAARRFVNDSGREDNMVWALTIDGAGVPAIRSLLHLVDERDERDG